MHPFTRTRRRRITGYWLASLVLTLPLLPLNADLLINEFMASNGTTLADENGDFSDWIEILNTGSAAVLLSDYGLTDNPQQPFRWRFPAVSIPPGAHLLVWASGKDRRDPAQALHANFSIAAEGETLLLSAPSGATVDRVDPVAVPRDQSYGRHPDGTATWYFFTTPTPGAANAGSYYAEILPPPAFSHTGGFFAQPIDLILQTPRTDLVILYTLDGSEPHPGSLGNGRTYTYKQSYPEQPGDPEGVLIQDTVHSFAYSGPLRLQAGTPAKLVHRSTTNHRDPGVYLPVEPLFSGQVVRARTWKEGAQGSPVVTQTYFFTPAGAIPCDLPVVALSISPDHLFDYNYGIYTAGKLFDDWRRFYPDLATEPWEGVANYYLRGSDWQYPAHLEMFTDSGQTISQRLGLRIHGGTTSHFPQKSLRLYAGSAYDPQGAIEYPIFPFLADQVTGAPIDSFQRLILRNAGNDYAGSRIRDALVQAILAPLAIPTQAWQPAVQFINGEYWGLINLRERYDRYYFASHYHIPEDDLALIELTAAGPELDEGGAADLDDLLALRAFIATHDMADPTHYAHLAGWLDIDQFLLYHMAQIFAKNTDWPGSNIRYWRKASPRPGDSQWPWHDGRWRYAFCDMDFAFGPFWGLDIDHDTLTFATAAGGDAWPNPDSATVMLRRLLANPDFRARFIQAFADHMATTFAPVRVAGLADAMHGRIAPYLDEHARRWRDFLNTGTAMYKDFAERRPAFVRQHVVDYFALPGSAELRFDVDDTNGGHLQINTIHLDATTPGLPDPGQPYPWQASYFQGVPLRVIAHPAPGYRFAGWEEFPEVSGPVLDLQPQPGQSITARFAPRPVHTLLHYWDFNSTPAPLAPRHSPAGGRLQFDAVAAPLAQYTLATGQGFSGSNTRLDVAVGSHLRVNNPIGARLLLHLPTTGHRDIQVSYETRRSGAGAGLQHIAYSSDGIHFQALATRVLFDAEPRIVNLDLTGIAGADDNPNFWLRIEFAAGDGGEVGNNRFDNLAVEGRTVSTILEHLDEPASRLAGSWIDHPDFGELRPLWHSGLPLLYSADTGWWLCHGTTPEAGFHFYHQATKRWFFTSPAIYPALYDMALGSWQVLARQGDAYWIFAYNSGFWAPAG
jgi:hypothetical protein